MENLVSTPSIWINEGKEIHFVNITKQMLAQVGTKAPLASIKTLMQFRKEMQNLNIHTHPMFQPCELNPHVTPNNVTYIRTQ